MSQSESQDQEIKEIAREVGEIKGIMSSLLENQEAILKRQKEYGKRLTMIESIFSSDEWKDLKRSVRTFTQIFHGDPNLGLSPLLERVNRMWLNYDRMRWLLALAISLGVIGWIWEWLKGQAP